MVRCCLGDFNVLNKTLSRVSRELCRVKFDLESKRSLNADYLDGFSVVDFGHALNFHEFDVVAFLIRVALVLVDSNGCFFLVSNRCNDERLSLFAVSVGNKMLLSVI